MNATVAPAPRMALAVKVDARTTHHFLSSSLPVAGRRSPQPHFAMRTVRSENSLHCTLGRTCREDESCLRIGHAAHNISRPQGPARNLLGRKAIAKGGLATKRKQAGWDNCPVRCSLPRTIGLRPPALYRRGHPVWNGEVWCGFNCVTGGLLQTQVAPEQVQGSSKAWGCPPSNFQIRHLPICRGPEVQGPETIMVGGANHPGRTQIQTRYPPSSGMSAPLA